MCRFIGCHAEVLALRKLVKRYGKSAFTMKLCLDITRHENKNSKPCADCFCYMKLFNINKVSYSDQGGMVTVKFCYLTSEYRRKWSCYDVNDNHRKISRP